MKSFKLWLEEEEEESQFPLSKWSNPTSKDKNYYNQVMKVLQATEDDFTKPITDLVGIQKPLVKNGEVQPPQKGHSAIVKLQNLLGPILQQMSNDNTDVDIAVRAKRTMDVLRSKSTDGKVEPVLYLQDLLRELFGNDFQSELAT